MTGFPQKLFIDNKHGQMLPGNSTDKIQKKKSVFLRLNYSRTEICLYFYLYFWLTTTGKNYNFGILFLYFVSHTGQILCMYFQCFIHS